MPEKNEKYMDVQIWLYDMWGNEQEGYEVNNQWRFESPITMHHTIWDDAKELKKVIRKYVLKPTCRYPIDIRFESENVTEFEIRVRVKGQTDMIAGRLEIDKVYN